MIQVSPLKIRLPKINFRPFNTPTDALAESIKAVGMVNPITCFIKDGKLTVRDGSLRLRAARKIGLKKVPVSLGSGSLERLYGLRPTDTEYQKRLWIALEEHSLTTISNTFGVSVANLKRRLKS